MLDVQVDGPAAVVTAQSPATPTRPAMPCRRRRCAPRSWQIRPGLRLEVFERFEHAWVCQVMAAATDAQAAPGIRRYVSQAFDDEALARGLLLQGHWHCPRCGTPGSQWSAGCRVAACPQPPPTSDAHWDHCRVATRDELLTLMVSEGYQRAGPLASGADVEALDTEWQALLRGRAARAGRRVVALGRSPARRLCRAHDRRAHVRGAPGPRAQLCRRTRTGASTIRGPVRRGLRHTHRRRCLEEVP